MELRQRPTGGGKVYNAKTNEVLDGKVYNITACFRAYNSLDESIQDYFNLICTASRYRKALTANTPKECIQAIKDGGYATDPNYVDKIMNLINSYNLTKYDKEINLVETEKYKVGNNYTLQDNMFVRTGAGTYYQIKSVWELTEDGKKHVLLQDSAAKAVLKKGTIVTCLEIIKENGNTWLRIPSGYVAANYKGVEYIK